MRATQARAAPGVDVDQPAPKAASKLSHEARRSSEECVASHESHRPNYESSRFVITTFADHPINRLAVDGAPPSVPPGAIPRSSRDGPARTRRACSEMASSVARGGLPAAVCCARTCARGWCGGAGVPRLPPAAPSSLARAMDLLGRGGPAPRWRARSLEAGLLRLRAAHLRTHVRKHARTRVVLWCVAWGMGRDVARTAAVERERGGMEAPPVGWGRAPRTRDGGLSVRSWSLGSAPAAPAKYPTRIQPPRWRDVARAAAMERERGDMETSAVGWGRAPRTRDGGLSVRSWFLGSAPAAPAKCHIPNEDPPPPPRRWRDVARAAAVERERGGMEASAVGWGRAPRTRDGGLSVRSWFSGLRSSHTQRGSILPHFRPPLQPPPSGPRSDCWPRCGVRWRWARLGSGHGRARRRARCGLRRWRLLARRLLGVGVLVPLARCYHALRCAALAPSPHAPFALRVSRLEIPNSLLTHCARQ